MASKVWILTENSREFPCNVLLKFAWEVPTVDLWRMVNFRKNWCSRFWNNSFLGFDPYAPCVKKFAIYNCSLLGSEKDINGVVYFWQWLLYTRVIGVVESPTTVYMRDDWEKLSDEKSSLRACRRRIPNRSRVVSCESRIVHMFYYLCLYSLRELPLRELNWSSNFDGELPEIPV